MKLQLRDVSFKHNPGNLVSEVDCQIIKSHAALLMGWDIFFIFTATLFLFYLGAVYI